ncbi:Hypothetical protein SMAX5B_010650 [Scophthalmus maximus]|uniref:Uncharacterized protein n=1 Tax=Scophthalmus maximus TaxID=52904 RepID=A0A2U9B2S0_SCOMX|nr:Hypothetical protein SMAX5B_010650 [Scophthalmus maximus]
MNEATSGVTNPGPNFQTLNGYEHLRTHCTRIIARESTRVTRFKSCGPDEGGPPEKESNYPGWRDPVGSPAGGRSPESLEHRNEDKERRIMEERRNKVLNVLSRLQEDTPRRGESSKGCCNFEDFDFLAKYCIFSQEKLDEYKRAFEAILEMVDFRVTDGLVDLRLFSVIASLAQKIASMDDFMRSLISSMDFRSLEVRLFKAKHGANLIKVPSSEHAVHSAPAL